MVDIARTHASNPNFLPECPCLGMRSVDFRVTAELGEFHEMFHDGGSFVEGIGDDMIIGLLVSVIIIIPVAGIMYRW